MFFKKSEKKLFYQKIYNWWKCLEINWERKCGTFSFVNKVLKF